MMPVMEPAPLLVIDSAGVPLVANAIAPAVKVPVLMVRPVSGVAPIAPLKVVSPVVVVDKVFAPVIVELKLRLPSAPLPVLAMAVVAPKVIAPKLIGLLLLIVPLSVTTPPTPVVVKPPA
jgi:hypothetical protein